MLIFYYLSTKQALTKNSYCTSTRSPTKSTITRHSKSPEYSLPQFPKLSIIHQPGENPRHKHVGKRKTRARASTFPLHSTQTHIQPSAGRSSPKRTRARAWPSVRRREKKESLSSLVHKREREEEDEEGERENRSAGARVYTCPLLFEI